MTNRSNDEIADALRRLGGGETPTDDTGDNQPPSLPPPPPRAEPAAGRQPMPGAPRPGASPRPARPLGPEAPADAPTRQRSAVPPPVGAAPTAHRPTAPMATPAAQSVPDPRPFAAMVDDDLAAMPAPPTEYLAHRVPAVSAPRPAGRRPDAAATRIPILLTTGALLLVAAALKYVVHPDAPLAMQPTWLAAVLAGGGVALIGLAITHVLRTRAAANPSNR